MAVPVLDDRSVRVIFGNGSLKNVRTEVSQLGRRALLITGRHERAPANVVSSLVGAELVGQLREVTQHVPVESAAGAVSHARSLRADVLITVGGGSVTGLAKAVALETGLPIVAVPTTYAGSEMTAIWGQTDSEGKTTGRDDRVLPRAVIYDPSLTLSLPPDITGASGMNALAHAIEALYAPDVPPMLLTVSEAAIAALATALPVAVGQPDDVDARAEALYGAWLAGWSLGSTTMGLHHKLAHVLGGTYRLPHAGVHSALLPHVAAYNASAARSGFTRAARALGVRLRDDVGAALFDLATRIAAPTSLAGLGLSRHTLDDVATIVTASGVANPRPVSRPDLVRLLDDAYWGTRPSAASGQDQQDS